MTKAPPISSRIRAHLRNNLSAMPTSMRKTMYVGRRGRRTGILASLATLISMLVASMGAAPAPAQDGVGSASVRGSDPDAQLVIGADESSVPAEYSAVTNCDEASNTRPFVGRLPSEDLTFRRTSTATSTCTSENGTSVNEGTGTGTVTLGVIPFAANLSWRFEESPDHVEIVVETVLGLGSASVSGAPQPLNGRPGGVWVFGALPWPAGE